jgi:polyisoprenoid-binding protein YceI
VKRILIAVAVLAVVVIAGGYVALRVTGGDDPPPPKLSAGGRASGPASGVLHPGRGSFVGYRVHEKYLGVGVRAAVGRTPDVTGTVTVSGDRVTAADLHADMRTVRSDQPQRDGTLRVAAIETRDYPDARFRLAAPFSLSPTPQRVTGRLLLHGRTAPVTVTVRGQRTRGRVELVGSAEIAFRRFAIKPPSIAGLVTVRDHGVLEFRLELA